LKGVANNLNQMTKWANANHALPAHLDRLLDDLGRAVVAVEQVAAIRGMAAGGEVPANDAGTTERPP
jgi:hypothetical protein